MKILIIPGYSHGNLNKNKNDNIDNVIIEISMLQLCKGYCMILESIIHIIEI